MGDHPIFESIDELVKADRLPKGYTAGKFLQWLGEKNLSTLVKGATGVIVKELASETTHREEEVVKLSQIFYFLEHGKKLRPNVQQLSACAFAFSAMIVVEHCVRQEHLRYRGEFNLKTFDPGNCWWLPSQQNNFFRNLIEKQADILTQPSGPPPSIDDWEKRFIELTSKGFLAPGARLGNYLDMLEDYEVAVMCHTAKIVLKEIAAAQKGKISGEKILPPSREAVAVITLAELMTVVERDSFALIPPTNTTLTIRFCVGIILEAMRRDKMIQLMTSPTMLGQRPKITASKEAVQFLKKHVELDHFVLEDMIDIHKSQNSQQGESKNELQ